MPEIREVYIVNDHLEIVIADLDLDGYTNSNLRNFILRGAGPDPDNNNQPIMKLEWEPNPNKSGVLFMNISQEELDRIYNVRSELLARGVTENFDEGADLKKTYPVELRGERADFDPKDPSYHRTTLKS